MGKQWETLLFCAPKSLQMVTTAMKLKDICSLEEKLDWGQEEKGTTEDEMTGWHHRLWTWVWVNFGSWWWTGMPGMLRFMGSQRVGHNWATELNWTELILYPDFIPVICRRVPVSASLYCHTISSLPCPMAAMLLHPSRCFKEDKSRTWIICNNMDVPEDYVS